MAANSSARSSTSPGEKTSLVVAQNGGFAETVGSYTWLWAEFNMEGNFARDPYWVEGSWKDALTALLLPLDRQGAFLLAGRAETPDSLLLQDGARPNDRNGVALLPGITGADQPVDGVFTEEKNGANGHEPVPTAPEVSLEKAADVPPPAEISEAPPATEEKPAEDSTPSEAPQIPPASEENHADVSVQPEAVAPAPPVEEKPPEEASPRIDTPEPFAIRWGMPQKLTWKDTDEIAYSLIDAHPDQDPLKLSFPKLHKLVTELEDFGDDPEKSSESILESIQMAWYEEVK